MRLAITHRDNAPLSKLFSSWSQVGDLEDWVSAPSAPATATSIKVASLLHMRRSYLTLVDMYTTNGRFRDVVHQHAQGTRQLNLALYSYLAGQFRKTQELAQVLETFIIYFIDAAVVLVKDYLKSGFPGCFYGIIDVFAHTKVAQQFDECTRSIGERMAGEILRVSFALGR